MTHHSRSNVPQFYLEKYNRVQDELLEVQKELENTPLRVNKEERMYVAGTIVPLLERYKEGSVRKSLWKRRISLS